ncbi:MAG TPA: hypothetical protein VJH03_14025 [Blastocatellia bacterium]|nr:hypothetical protein [Blastocatellia bacterium]
MRYFKLSLGCVFVLATLAAVTRMSSGYAAQSPGQSAPPCVIPADPCTWPLPLPSQVGIDCYEKIIGEFLQKGCYKNWAQDREIRDTGPFIDASTDTTQGLSYGTHSAVKIYYSPEVWEWLTHGRRGEIKDGAIIIKEGYPSPAQQKITKNYTMQGYTIMVRDSKQSWDGWYWTSGIGVGNAYKPPFNYPNAGYGQYCINCHASADNPASTYSALRNIVGDPITYLRVLPSMDPTEGIDEGAHERKHRFAMLKAARGSAQPPPSREFMALYNSIKESDIPTPHDLPSESWDHVVQGPRPEGQKMFVTSDQCIGCHDGTQSNSALPNMIYTPVGANININLSPYGEWRASMMGLSGRDPIFYAQLETERTLHPELGPQIDNKCLSCHGVMGQRQFFNDKHRPFTHDLVLATPDNNLAPEAAYGALARDGVSCMVCHRILADGLGTEETYTGKFKLAPKPDEVYGPFEKVVAFPMKNALGLTPLKTKDNQITRSDLCGSCHIVEVPVLNVGEKYPPDALDHPKKIAHEQSTYFEWRNSIYSDETKPVPSTAKTCQDCHLPNQYKGDTLKFRIANIEDNTFAYVDNRAPDEEITLMVRGKEKGESYRRHLLAGINLFANQMFQQYWDSIGIRNSDPMATFGNPQPGLETAEAAGLDLATQETAKIEIVSVNKTARGLEAKVKVTNLAGHKFPSGVGFRRAFIEFQVLDASANRLWASGLTSDLGVILNGLTGKPLPTEFFDAGPDGKQMYQKYHETITRGDQVQIYEELTRDNRGQFTTSFLSLDHQVKDTRVMPQGWSPTGPQAKITEPDGGDGAPVGKSYYDGSGSDVVTYKVDLGGNASRASVVVATIYYQSIPPYYLQQRFTTSPDKPFTRNLWYYGSRLMTNAPGSPINSWKLKIVTASKKLR